MEERNLKDKSLVSLSRARDDDMLSKLPDSLISHILLDLPTKEAVRTCVLSKRWKSLWLLTPGLDLKSNEFPNYNAFVSFMNKLLDFSRVHYSCLHKLKLGIHDSPFDRSYLTLWIHFVATHKVKVLDVESFVVDRVFLKVMPLSLYICETLVYLRLHRVFLGNFGSASLTCLKTLCLEQNIYANEAVLESLILSCPVLEDLKIGRMFDENVRVLRVRSKTITSLGIIKHYLGRNDFEIQELEVLIDTPNLKYLNLEDEFPKRKTFCELSSLTEANFLGGLSLRDSVDPLLSTSIFGVRDMKISSKAFKFIQRILIKPSPPEFCNLSSLEAKLDLSNLRTLPWFLSSCKNIRSLILDLQDFYPRREKLIILSLVPQCLLSSLEYVEIKKVSPFTRDPNEMEVAKYFLENSIVLKKFVLRLRCSLREEDLVVYKEDLLKLRRQSSACQRCQIVVCS